MVCPVWVILRGVSQLWGAFAVQVVCPRRFTPAGGFEWCVPTAGTPFASAALSGVSPPVQPPAGWSGEVGVVCPRLVAVWPVVCPCRGAIPEPAVFWA